MTESFSCDTIRKGVFVAGAVFVVATMVLNVYFYVYFTKATTQPAHKTNRSSSTVGRRPLCYTLPRLGDDRGL
nr:hypothetical protein CTI12_AA022040 [Tanacetum cinerariifolium]